MSHWAKVESGIVTDVTNGDDSTTNAEQFQWLVDNLGGTWIRTSYNTHGGVHNGNGTPLNKNYAGKGFTWDGVGFSPPKPFPSWTLDQNTYLWNAPTPMPTDGQIYQWDEATLSWKVII